jgi:hypothetical protein
MVVAVNGVALAWPFVHKVLSGKLADYYDMTMEVYYWCCSKYARWCGSKEQRAQIAAADAKIKKKKQKGKQMVTEADAVAKAARVKAGAQTQATSHSELVFRDMLEQTSAAGVNAKLGIVCEREIPEITAPAELAENTESGQATAVSRPRTIVFDDNLILVPDSTGRHQTSITSSAVVMPSGIGLNTRPRALIYVGAHAYKYVGHETAN